MPLYEYQCKSCGHEKTVLSKMSAARVRKCPVCGKPRAFTKLISAASFKLKGNGWYATDFRDSGTKKGGSKDQKDNGAKAAENDINAKKPDTGDTKKPAQDAAKNPGGKGEAARAAK